MTLEVWHLGILPAGVGGTGPTAETVDLPGTQYRLRVFDTSGTLVAEVTDFLELAYTKRLHEAGLCQFMVTGDHGLVGSIADKYMVEVWRRNARMGVAWYRDFHGMLRKEERFFDEQPLFVGTAVGDLAMLGWRIVGWYAGTNLRSQFTNDPAETVMKSIVSYNCGAEATTGNGRVRAGTITGLSVQADNGGGNSVDWYCSWKNVLKTLEELARIAGGDFDLVKTGAAAWEFRFYPGQRGVDRSTGPSRVTFSLDLGNMAAPRYKLDRLAETTVAIVAGQGQGDARAVEIRTGTGYGVGNDIELYVDARNTETASGLDAKGDARLDEAWARQSFKFGVLQTPACFYGKHYCVNGVLGDLVAAKYDTVSGTQKIVGVTVAVDSKGQERISVEMEQVYSGD